MRSVWLKACTRHVLNKQLPFPNEPVESLTSAQLEQRTRHALHLEANWASAHPEPCRASSFKANSSNVISDVRFVPRHGHEWLLTVSKGIWSVVACWDLLDEGGAGTVGEWTCRGALIRDVVVNTDPTSVACWAISVTQNGYVLPLNAMMIRSAGCQVPSHRSPDNQPGTWAPA